MPETRILMGVIGRPHGVRGMVHVHSYTADPTALEQYGPFTDERGRRFAVRWWRDGVAEVAELTDAGAQPVRDRGAAEALVNIRLYAERDRLPPAEDDEFYFADLVGLAARDANGTALGTVDAVHDYGAGASLEIGRLLVPFTRAAVPVVDIAGGFVVIAPPSEVVADPAGTNRAEAAQ